jgi:dTDP-4-dehydrorhamnose reductase
VADDTLPVHVTDLTVGTAVSTLLTRVAPAAIIHCAALASIEECEKRPEHARRLNVEVPRLLAVHAARAGVPLVHISTDAVFEGARGLHAHRETDEPSPLSIYARTKKDAERAVLDAYPQALVARVNFYGWSPSGRRSLAEYFTTSLAQGTPTPGFTDVTVSTLYVGDLVDALVELVDVQATGIVNVTSSQAITKFDFGRLIATGLGVDPGLVVPTLSSQLLDVPRGQFLALDTSRAARLLGREMPRQSAGIERLLSDRASGVPRWVARLRHRESTVVAHEDR